MKQFIALLCIGLVAGNLLAQTIPIRKAAPADPAELISMGSEAQFFYVTTDNGMLVPFVSIAPAKPQAPVSVVVFLHQGNSNYSIFLKQALEAQSQGILSILLDFGVNIPNQRTVAWRQAQYGLDTLMDWLKTSSSIRTDRISLAGSSMGANVGLVYFGLHPELRSVFALSPALNYDEVRPTDYLSKFQGRSAVIVASEDDPQSFAALTTWKKKIPGPEYVGYTRGGHGVDQFLPTNDLALRYTNWLKTLQ